ncbi:MAG TPA: valine--tRNA ligase [Candidatus Jacksonbacteria bacterium]|nr:valine--tRNA ligase [Candidatus Jacksonbacteria bacterium]
MIFPKAYSALKEDEIYAAWEASGFFQPKAGPPKTFCISMPPPNATGALHIGHAMGLTLQDLMTRYNRMKGKASLWLPGTDHASIATQNKVEKIIFEKDGKTRHDFTRAAFLAYVESFVKESQGTIRRQMRKMGASCDWSRERYTLDEGLTRAVQEVFVRMYRDGLIYRGDRIVNWCPRCASTLADDEVEYKPTKGKFYYFRYGPVVIGTARPETKFLDKTIIVHPKDKRYAKLVGKTFAVPWIDGKVEARVIADSTVDMEVGSGAMTLTPAHSFIDFYLAQKYHLPIIQIIDEKGNLTDAAGEFAGMNAHKAREKIVAKMLVKGLVERIDENYEHNLSVCYRCGTPIEPLVSRQWFIDVNHELRITNYELRKVVGKSRASLKEMGIAVVKKGAIKIIPDRFNKTYFHWMENLRDWCISRQIWFGHRIPVWYCIGDNKCLLACKNPIVSIDTPLACPHCGSKNLKQDPDTLDTWFSSGLWTFSTLGWPEKTRDLKQFHPTSVMETSYDILFFWVARMILMSTYALGQVPFRTVYLHGLVRDKLGRKMSKSLGNGIDPLDMIKKFGADAVRLSLVIGTAPGNDIRLYEEKIAGYRNFVNKVWNIARFVLSRSKKQEARIKNIKMKNFTLADHWILWELGELVKRVNKNLEKFRFSAAGEDIYEFMWHKFADIYIEETKREKREHQQEILEYVLERCLIMLHPFVPFVTEEIWKIMNYELRITNYELLIVQPWVEKLDITVSKARALEFIKAREMKKQPTLSETEKKELKSYIASLEARLKNKQFLAKAPPQVVEKERGRLKEANTKLTIAQNL